MLSLVTLEGRQKKFFKLISNSHIFLFLSHSFEMETINFSYIPVVPSKTIPNSRLKWAKCIPIFRRKRRKNPTRWGGTYLYGLYKGVLPGVEEIRVIVIAFVYLKYKQNSPTNQINHAGNTLQTDPHKIGKPCLGQRRQKLCPGYQNIPDQGERCLSPMFFAMLTC